MEEQHQIFQALQEELALHREVTWAIHKLLNKYDELEQSITNLINKHKELLDCDS